MREPDPPDVRPQDAEELQDMEAEVRALQAEAQQPAGTTAPEPDATPAGGEPTLDEEAAAPDGGEGGSIEPEPEPEAKLTPAQEKLARAVEDRTASWRAALERKWTGCTHAPRRPQADTIAVTL
jgi:hypothetical protein